MTYNIARERHSGVRPTSKLWSMLSPLYESSVPYAHTACAHTHRSPALPQSRRVVLLCLTPAESRSAAEGGRRGNAFVSRRERASTRTHNAHACMCASASAPPQSYGLRLCWSGASERREYENGPRGSRMIFRRTNKSVKLCSLVEA